MKLWILVDGEKVDELETPLDLSDAGIALLENSYYEQTGFKVKMVRAQTAADFHHD